MHFWNKYFHLVLESQNSIRPWLCLKKVQLNTKLANDPERLKHMDTENTFFLILLLQKWKKWGERQTTSLAARMAKSINHLKPEFLLMTPFKNNWANIKNCPFPKPKTAI